MTELIFMKELMLIKIYQLVKNVIYVVIGNFNLNLNFNCQKYMCNGCHEKYTKAISLHNLCIGYNNGSACRINFVFMH